MGDLCRTLNATCSNCGRITSVHNDFRNKLHLYPWSNHEWKYRWLHKIKLSLTYGICQYLDKLLYGNQGEICFDDYTTEVDFVTQSNCYLCSKQGVTYRFYDSAGKLLKVW